MGPKFFETRMGQQFYDATMPRIAKALERIAAALEAQATTPPKETLARSGEEPTERHNINRAAYERIVAEDLEWLVQQPRTLERDHVEIIVRQSPERYYGPAAGAGTPPDEVKTTAARLQCPHRRIVATIASSELLCPACGLAHTNLLMQTLNEKVERIIAALDHAGIGRCHQCDDLLPKAQLLWLRLAGDVGVDGVAQGVSDETLGNVYCVGCAVMWLEGHTDDDYTTTLTDDQLRWFSEQCAPGYLPEWLRDEIHRRIGYRSLDLTTTTTGESK